MYSGEGNGLSYRIGAEGRTNDLVRSVCRIIRILVRQPIVLMRYRIVALLLAFTIYGCATLIPAFIPKAQGELCSAPDCLEADAYFWDQFHAGHFDSIPQVLFKLQNAYLNNQQDWRLAAHIGFTHAWAIAEYEKGENTPLVTDHATLANYYFKKAFDLNPKKDWRHYGFWASFLMAEGGIHNDTKDMVGGYFTMKKALRKYPEFNLFTAAYTLASSPRPQDREAAVDMLWKNLDKCAGERVDRDRLDYRKYLPQKEVNGKMSTCWNTFIAPHNMEGFLLVLGDLLVKRGDLERALRVYENARYFEEYDYWAFKALNEARIRDVRQAIERNLMVESINLPAFDRCMVCHQERRFAPVPADAHVNFPAMAVEVHLRD